MTDKNGHDAAPKLDLGQILYVLFRHKWKIIGLCLFALAAAASVLVIVPRTYESEARLYIRYVVEPRSPDPIASDSRIRSPDVGGDAIINTELQILTSMDLAQQVADAIGPEKILGVAGLPDGRVRAAVAIQKHLVAQIPRDSSVVRVAFQHTDPSVVQPVVRQLIECYFKKHAQIHARGAFDKFLETETDQRRSRVETTEEQLRKAKSPLGIISLQDSRQSVSAQISRLEQQVAETEAQLAERRASVDEMTKALRGPGPQGTNATADTSLFEPVPSDKQDQYHQVCAILIGLKRREQELLLTFTPASPLVKEVQQQIATNAATKQNLEKLYPALLATAFAITNNSAGVPAADAHAALANEMAQVSGLEARLKVLKDQLAQYQKKGAALVDAEGSIMDLERQLQIQETNYTRFAQSLEQAQIEARLGAGKVSNISTIQEPTPALNVPGKRLKIVAIVFLGGLALAFGLPFAIELYLDPSIKNAADVQTRLRLPLFVSIPLLDQGKRRGLADASLPLLPAGSPGDDLQIVSPGSQKELALWQDGHALKPFSEALRDRLITWFDVKQLTHKPKLVAVTSCNPGAGVSTIAAGLAASLSETGEGNVLLVDMTHEGGGAAYFHKGDLDCGLDDALELDKREQAQVQDKLYMVAESPNSQKLPAALPKRFQSLVPKLRASDYDYIIFDMPPVSQISITARLARFMDTVLMVAESERTDREFLKKAASFLQQGQQNIGVVLNKTRSYVPSSLKPEL